MGGFGPHPFLPMRTPGLLSPDICAALGCGRPWDDPAAHRPSRYLALADPQRTALEAARRAAQDARMSEDLARQERASGPPRDPSADAQAEETETPRKLYEVPADGYIPRGFAQMHGLDAASFAGNTRSGMRAAAAGQLKGLMDSVEGWQLPVDFDAAQSALTKLGGMSEQHLKMREAMGLGLVRNGVTTEIHACDATEVHEKHLWQPGAQTEWFTCRGDLVPDEVDEYCDHPNGFGPNGCPCGAVREEEDELPTFRNLETGRDEPARLCPECVSPETVWPVKHLRQHLQRTELSGHGWTDQMYDDWAESVGLPEMSPYEMGEADHPTESPIWGHAINCPACDDAFLKSRIRGHLQTVHQWTGDAWTDWAESVNFLELSPIPDLVQAAMNEAGPELAKAVDSFLDPSVTVEDLTHMADNNPSQSPQDFHTWWVAMADREAPTIQRKAEEYGTNSLIEMGRIWARAQGRSVEDLDAVEIGCFLYAYGKIQRVADALLKGKVPNVDSWRDLAIYSMMVQYSREKGNWP